MKKYMICTGFFLLMFLCGNDLKSQEPIMPDFQFQSSLKDLVWTENGTSFCNYNGDLYMIVWTPEFNLIAYERYYPCVYLYSGGEFQPFLVNNTNKIVFGYPGEGDYTYNATAETYYFIIYGKPLFFSYYGKMWFYSMIHKFGDGIWTYYELWANYDDETGWKTWYSQMDYLPSKLNVDVCQADSTLRIITNEAVTKQFFANDYQYNSMTNDLDFQQSSVLPISADRLDDVITYKDVNGNNCFIYDTYMESNKQLYLHQYSPVTGWNLLGTSILTEISALQQGSLQGMKPAELFLPEESNRFNFFYIGSEKISNGAYPLYVEEWWIPEDTAMTPQRCHYSVIILPESANPDKIYKEDYIHKEFCLQSVNLMTPVKFNAQSPFDDGLQNQLMAFYPDSKKKINGAIFNSDFWRPVPGSSVSSLDLGDDSLYGPQIRKLWTLVGIVDGAPPCSIDWPVWEENHFTDEPTELSFTVEDVTTSEVTSSYEDTYSLGGKIKTGFSKLVTFEGSFKYANTYKSKVSSGNTIKSSLATNFGLNEHSQEFGYYIWNIPQITRVSYQVYPWYDKNLVYPVSNSLQYQFRTLGALTVVENKEISEFPFLINEPNNADLAEWKAGQRQAMYTDISGYGLSPLKSIGWTNPNAGQVFTFSETNTATSTVEKTDSYSWGLGMTVKVPEVFQITGSYEQDISYSTETSYETEFGTEVEVSLKALTDKVYGINISYYDMSIFWFKPNVADWWYLDSLEGYTPWYISYLVGTVHPQLNLLSPAPQSRVNRSDLYFSWKAEEGELGDYTFYISTEPQFGPGTTVYSLSCGNQTAVKVPDFISEKDKSYYWAVRGLAANGEMVWSEARIFSLKEEDLSMPEGSELKANIYPNPLSKRETTITFELEKPGTVCFDLYESNGRLLYQNRKEYQAEGVYTEFISLGDVSPGIYYMKISLGQANATKKIILLR